MSEKQDFTKLSQVEPVKKYAFVFVCQKGNLEIESLLLAASLKRFLKCDYELIAAIPHPIEIFGKPRTTTIDSLKKMGVRIVDIYNDIVPKKNFEKRHLVANKYPCLRIPTDADKLIFLDSDILFYKDFFGDIRFSIPLNLVRVGFLGASMYSGIYKEIFESMGIELPSLLIRIEKENKVTYTPPHFNSGFVAIKTDLAPKLSKYWSDFFKKLEAEKTLENPLHTDQIALALAVQKMNVPYEILFLDRSLNNPSFFHYSLLERLKNSVKMRELAKYLAKELPEIKELVRDHPAWQFLLN